MAAVTRFEDLEVWQVARILTREIYNVTKHSAFTQDFGLKNQIQRAAVSILSNIAEGFERNGNKELCNFLYIAKGSAGEVRAQLYVAQDLGYITEEEFEMLGALAQRCSSMLYRFCETVKDSPIQGLKYRQP